MADGPIAEVGVAGIIILLVLQMVFGYMKARNGKRNSNSNPGHGVTLAPNQRTGLDQVSHDKLQRIEDGIHDVNKALTEVLVLLRSRLP